MDQDFSKRREWIASCDEPERLRAFMKNAENKGVLELYEQARSRLFEIQASTECETVGTVEHEVWESIHALEYVRTKEAGKTIRLSRTRQAIGRKGVRQALVDIVRKKGPSEGFDMLRDRNMLKHSFEAIVLRHLEDFDDSVTEAAHKRLAAAGCDPAQFLSEENAGS